MTICCPDRHASKAEARPAGGVRFVRALGAVLVAVGALWNAAPAWSGEQEDLAVEGREIVKANCAKCHAIGVDDKSPHEKAPPFREVVDFYPSEDLAEALAEGIVSGHPDMPVFVMKPPEIEAFLAYLRQLYDESQAAGKKTD